MKLTKPQIEVLKILSVGGWISVEGSISFYNGDGHLACKPRMVRPLLDALIRTGAVERTERTRISGSYAYREVYGITDLGRAAIGAQEVSVDAGPA
jgi:hypothetical protein